MEQAAFEDIGAVLRAQGETLGVIRDLLERIAQAATAPAVSPDHQWVDVDGACAILSMKRRQFVERVSVRSDFPKPARLTRNGRPRWKVADLSEWMEAQT